MANLVLAFAELLAGAIILDAGIKGDTVGNVITGKATQHPLTSSAGDVTGGAVSSATGAMSAGNIFGNTEPSRLDQGEDLIGTQFNAPVAGKITQADQSNSGWGGGGLIMMTLDTPIRLADGTIVKALYWAEDIAPTVQVGQHVNIGDQIGVPGQQGSYGQGPGAIEWGPAVPGSNGQPLAQAVSDPRGLVLAWYQWALSVGAPQASSTGQAGSA